jgi:hypothetical protein
LVSLLANPLVSDFLDALDALCPEQTPPIGQDVARTNADAGKRELIRTLLKLRQEAREKLLEAPLV